MFNGLYNPYFQSSYPVYNYSCQRQHSRAEALLAQRARRAQYLPHEEIGLRENLYLEARRQQALDNERRRRDAEAERYQQQLGELRRSHHEYVQRKRHVPNNEPATTSTQIPCKDSSSRPPTPPVEYTDVHHEAARQIQRLYHQRCSLHSIDNIVSQFQETRNSFTVPQAIDFINSSLPSTDENVITVDTTSYVTNSGVNVSGPSGNIDINAADTEDSNVAPSEIDAASRDQIHGANTMDSEAFDGTRQVPEPTTPSADDEFVIVKDDESNTMSEPSAPTIPSGDGEFVIIEGDQSSVAAQAGTTANNRVEMAGEYSSVESPAAVTDNAEMSSEETVDNVDSEEITPQLAYTTRNYPVHAYFEKLNVLLTKLDSIDSYGSQNVRDRRKDAARSIEREAGRIELVVRDAWRKHLRA
ncbi:hypothetical protein APHAL10511_002836 [Amanita phalloides]|nr:hypothetical protein APHAL10511_002836 [Amanita phalloides]